MAADAALTELVDPAVYPWSLYEIYPAVSHKAVSASVGVMVNLQSHYPVFNICE